MDVKKSIKMIFGANDNGQKKYKNVSSQSAVQIKRLDNYSEELLAVLDEYSNEIDSAISPYDRKSTEETMMVSSLRRASQETTTRKMHMENMEGIAVEIAKKLGLCEGATRVIARHHDIGHTFFGHAGERWLSSIKEDLGIGFYTHNALGPQELIYHRNIYDEILERIIEFNPDITRQELSRIRKSLWLIFDGINAHNGEKTETEFIPDRSKDNVDFERELRSCFTIKGFDKTIVPATMEGCLIRLCDKISYIPYDMVDGIREGFIEEIDEEYIPILVALGVSEDEIKKCNTKKNYDSIVRRLQINLTKDVIKNSTSSAIRMSGEISKQLHEFRNLNNRRIVKYNILAEDNEIYPKAIRTLMDELANYIMKSDFLDELDYGEISKQTGEKIVSELKNTPFEDFGSYLVSITHTEYKFTQEMIYQAIIQTIIREQEIARQIVLGKQEFIQQKGYEKRDSRIAKYVDYYKNIGITEKYEELYAKRDMEQELASGEYNENGHGFDKKLALEIGARYLSKLNDFEIFNLIKETGLITEEQAKSLTRTYKEIGRDGIKSEHDVQDGFKKLMEEQIVETKKMGNIQSEKKQYER